MIVFAVFTKFGALFLTIPDPVIGGAFFVLFGMWIIVGDFEQYFWYSLLWSYGVQANSAFHPSWVGKWGPASAGKEKAGMVHSISRWTRGVQVKLWDPLRMCAIPERLRGVFTTKRYTNPRLPYLTLPYYHQVCSIYSTVIDVFESWQSPLMGI